MRRTHNDIKNRAAEMSKSLQSPATDRCTIPAPSALSEGNASSNIFVSVILPTYCEAANLPLIVPRIRDALERLNRRYEIIVVDDNSPDETQAICRELVVSCPLRLIVRPNERGAANQHAPLCARVFVGAP